jgi:tRNA(Ile)-lysidine synthase TilS/MesJ
MRQPAREKILLSWSGGKDSTIAAWQLVDVGEGQG